jgi:hypothetical protein
MEISPDAMIKALDRHVSCELDDEAVILSLSDGVYYGLNPVAARIWELIQHKPLSLRAICSLLADEYAVDLDRCEHEVRVLVAKLRDWNLVEVVVRDTIP